MNADPTPTPGTFPHIEQTIRALGSEKAVGDAFERLCRFFLRNAPQYKSELKAVWLWNEWPGRWGADKGIDLVAEAMDGKLWAIQAKGVHPDRTIPKRELDSFLSESNRPQFDFRLIIASTDDIGRNALDTIKGQVIPVGLVLRGDLLAAELRWPSQIGEQPPALPLKEPRPHQQTAITKVVEGFCTHDRGQLIMACGTGKTVTALWIAERLNSRRTLMLVPSLSLVSQTLTEWGCNCREPFEYLVVCSDETAAHRGEDHAVNSTGELGVPVTTDPAAISQFLARQRGGKPAVVFCTYQSSGRVAASQRSTTVLFDLVIADEAHRCTGHAESGFATVLDATKIKAKKRLFMTATPRYFSERVKSKAEDLDFELASMDDPERFGPEFYSLSFADAIDADLLTDYQVVVIGVTQAEARRWADEARLVRTEDGLHTDACTLAAQIGLAKAMREYDLRKIITFHSSVAKASRFTDASVADSLVAVIERLPGASKPSGNLWANHISGKTPAGKRTTLLHTFGTRGSDTRSVLSNCSCLGEGVDVPALDGIAFIDPKRSMVDIIQAVGRVMRKASDKRLGTVVIPVFVDESDDAEYALSSSAFEPVWQVLRALRAHDTMLAAELDELRMKLGTRSAYGGKIRLPEKITLDLPTLLLHDFEQAFYVRALERAARRPPLTVDQILAWADAHHQRTDQWPNVKSGPVHDAPEETWEGIHGALNKGGRGLPGGSSLAQVLADHRGVRNIGNLPALTVEQILAWADAHHQRTGQWPAGKSGSVHDIPGEKWGSINGALHEGLRGLSGGSSLAQLLADHRGKRNVQNLSALTIEQILAWADAHHQRTGQWPKRQSGAVHDAPGETWNGIASALYKGTRGLPGGLPLAQLLADHRGVRNIGNLPELTTDQILAWADAHHQRTGQWPKQQSGPVCDAPGETWLALNTSLDRGQRGLPGGSSLPQVLADHRGVRNIGNLPALTVEQILAWADAHHQLTDQWPSKKSGPVHDAPGETWRNIDSALGQGQRGLPGGSSLPQVLADHRGKRNIQNLPDLTVEQILVWADAHHQLTDQWPSKKSGPVHDAPGETWRNIDSALGQGQRGLPGGSSLPQVLADHRGKRNIQNLPDLTVEQILVWADAHRQRTGQWPKQQSGPVCDAPGETWLALNTSLDRGGRGLLCGSSLAQVLADHRGKRNIQNLSDLNKEQILTWADAHHQRTGQWPNVKSGAVYDAPEEKWENIHGALNKGLRGLPCGSSLAQVLDDHRGVRNIGNLPALMVDQILTWADAHHQRTGQWPSLKSGPVHEAPGETWENINGALHKGLRGLPGGSSLAKLIKQYRRSKG